MRHIDKSRLGAVAAAVALALGTASALAQQEPQFPRQTEQQQQPGQAQQQPGQAQQQPGQAQQQPGQAQQQPGQARQPGQLPADESEQRADQGLESEREPSAQSQGAGDFDQLTAEHENLATFVKAVKAAGLEQALTQGTEYTVFAPTDEAWEGKDGKNVDELMQPENREELVSLLRAHIVADNVDAELASTIDKAQTIDGGTVDIQSENGELMVGGAKAVDTAGIEMDNLRIYPIDGVLASNASQAGAFDEAGRESEDGVQDRAQGRPSDDSDIDSPDFDTPDVEAPDFETRDEPQPRDIPQTQDNPQRP